MPEKKFLRFILPVTPLSANCNTSPGQKTTASRTPFTRLKSKARQFRKGPVQTDSLDVIDCVLDAL